MNIWKKISVILLVCFCSIGCDQSSKYYASEHLQRNTMSSYLGDTVRVGYTENTGAFLGMGSNLPENIRFLLFTVLVGFILLALLFYMMFFNHKTVLLVVAIALMFSGGVSNFIDRTMNNGAVVDFLNVGIGSLRTGIFNIADMAVLLGCLLMFFASSVEADREST